MNTSPHQRPNATGTRLLRLPEVLAISGLSRSSVYAAIRANTFPAPIAIGLRARAWISDEIEAWIAGQVRKSRP